jgi:hypothetical protein
MSTRHKLGSINGREYGERLPLNSLAPLSIIYAAGL